MNAKLKYPVMGFSKIRLLIKHDCKWIAELIGANLKIEVSEEDFVLFKKDKKNIDYLFNLLI